MGGVVRALARVVGGLALAVVLGDAVLVLVNWRDAPPSAEVRVFEAMERAQPPVDDRINAYTYLLGFAAPPDVDPVALGARRRAWLETFPPARGPVATMPGKEAPRVARDAAFAAVVAACREATADCAARLREGEGGLNVALAREHVALDRYAQLIARRQFRETPMRHPAMPLPPYGEVVGAQQLYLIRTWQLARAGDVAGVRSRLGDDLAFWRGVLASSDLLITKMIAAAAIRRDLGLGNLALRELPPVRSADAVPPVWRTPITRHERSMARAFAGEWRFADATLGMTDVDDDASTPLDRASALLSRPLFLRQDTSNRFAARMAVLGALSESPYERLPRVLDAQVARWSEEASMLRAYNPVGNILDVVAMGGGMRDYVLRVSDLEGLRRATLLAQALRSQGADASPENTAVDATGLRDPYDGRPLQHDTRRGVVVFTGYQRGARARTEVLL